jgi:hypothetical protein
MKHREYRLCYARCVEEYPRKEEIETDMTEMKKSGI